MRTERNSWLWKLWSTTEFKLILAWLVVIVATAILDHPNHTYWEDPKGCAELILRNAVMLGIFAVGSSVIIISGGIDLSCGSVIALSSTVFGMSLYFLDPSGFQAGNVAVWVTLTSVLLTLLLGFLIGTLHAWLITCVGLPPFIATLATLVGLRSFGRALTDMFLSKSQVEFPGRSLRDVLTNLTYLSVLFAILAAGLWFLMSRTVIGRHLVALGGNEQAARLSGIRTDRLKWLAYVIGAMTSSIGGIIYFAYSGSAKPDILARGYELNAIAASVIGGCSLQGGVGTITGTVLGCFFLSTVIDSVTRTVGIGADLYEGMIVGIVVVLAVTFSQRGKQVERHLFHSAIGWAAIPTLGLLASLVYVLFLGKREGYQWWHAAIFGSIVLAALVFRAMLERRQLQRLRKSSP